MVLNRSPEVTVNTRKYPIIAVYRITNTINGECYIGSSENVGRRYYTHKAALNRGESRHPLLQKAVSDFGLGSFEFVVLEFVSSEERIAREQFWFDALKPTLNVNEKAISRRGMPLSQEWRENISRARTGIVHCSEATVEKIIATKVARGLIKGRIQRRAVPYTHPIGEANPHAKLTAEIVTEIRRRVALGESQQSVADHFSTPQTNVSRIVRRKAWNHVA